MIKIERVIQKDMGQRWPVRTVVKIFNWTILTLTWNGVSNAEMFKDPGRKSETIS